MVDATGNTTINQTEPEKNQPDQMVPMLGGDMDIEEVKANFNALLYLLTEQMAVQLALLDTLVKKDLLAADEINEDILKVTGNQEELVHVYNELFSRFVGYYSSLRKLMADGKVLNKEGVPNE
jgi:hypothetical protein